MIHSKIVEKYFFFGLLFVTFLLSFFVFKPFWVVLVLGICFSIVLHPVFNWFKKINFSNTLSSFLTVILFAIILCGPILGIGIMIFKQSENVYTSVVSNNSSSVFINSIGESINKYLPEGVVFDMNAKVSDFISYISQNIAKIFKTTVSAFFSFILMLLIIFYFLKDGHKLKESLVKLSPLSDVDDEKIVREITQAIKAVMEGYILIGFIQGSLMGVGLWLFNVPNPALWGVVAAICSLLPNIGTALVSIPSIVFLYATGNSASALGLLIWSIIVVGMIDNFLSPTIVGKKIEISPILILFSVLGGISLLGAIGVLIGPLLISLLYTLISIYRNEFYLKS